MFNGFLTELSTEFNSNLNQEIIILYTIKVLIDYSEDDTTINKTS